MCVSPLKGFPDGLTPSGKTNYIVTSYNVHHIEMNFSGSRIYADSDFVSPYATRVIRDFIEIPCGHCIECRLEYSREWADRCLLELDYHQSSYFVTLTYDEEHVPVNKYTDDFGEIHNILTLVKRDVQLFIKRLRRKLDYYNKDPTIMYFGSGEYGSHTLRPHYHLIIFGLELDDLELLKRSSLGYNYYTSDFISSCWTKGYSMVADVSWETCAYVARYIMKKQKGENKKIYQEKNFEPEFSVMSLKPAIGKRYFEEHTYDIYKYDYMNVSTPNGGVRVYPCKYFDRLMEKYDEEFYRAMKEKRKERAIDKQKLVDMQSDYSRVEQFAVEEENLIDRLSKLVRNKI